MVLGCRGRRRSDAADLQAGHHSDWMTKLPEHVKKRPISELCIPGSHDSFTSSLVPGSVPGPDQPDLIRKLAADFPRLAKHILYRWSYTQHKDVIFQLENGIRYFDIRLVADDVAEEFLIIHCLYGEAVHLILREIRNFLDQHPGEVVILDFQHLYNFCPKDHLQLMNVICSTFEERLCPCPGESKPVSLDFLQRNGLQVILLYPLVHGDFCWPRHMCPNPWANTTSSSHLSRFLTNGLETRDTEKLFVSQGVFTPNLGTVLMYCFSNLEYACSRRCNKTVRKWLTSLKTRPNVLIIDFALSSAVSCQIVHLLINLNMQEK